MKADYRISAVRLRDELTSGQRTILLVLMAGSVLVFVIACSNVANLILARTVRRETELGIRAALGARTGALRCTLLTESLLLCAGGATLGILIANPMLEVIARYISRFSVRALDLTVDSSMLWVGAGLAMVAAALLAFVPRLPSAARSNPWAPPRGRGAANGVRSSHDAQISLDNLYLGVKRRRNVELRTACPLEVRGEKGVHAVGRNGKLATSVDTEHT